MSYIPTQDAQLDVWALNFATLISTEPSRYGISTADGAVLMSQYNVWHAAYLLAVNPITRTQPAIADKDGEKVTLLYLVRLYAAQIRANAGVTDEDKAALGLNIPDPTPTPIPVPTTSPSIKVIIAGDGTHQLSVTDVLTPTKKAKPYGVVGALLVAKTSPTWPVSMDDAPVIAVITRSDFVVDTSAMETGDYAGYRARWFNSKGEFGPWGAIAGFVVTGDPAPATP